jgi:cytochrome c2
MSAMLTRHSRTKPAHGCAVCHQVDEARRTLPVWCSRELSVGPYAPKAGYSYSAADRNSGPTWDDATLR